jgi:hypothetical protein
MRARAQPVSFYIFCKVSCRPLSENTKISTVDGTILSAEEEVLAPAVQRRSPESTRFLMARASRIRGSAGAKPVWPQLLPSRVGLLITASPPHRNPSQSKWRCMHRPRAANHIRSFAFLHYSSSYLVSTQVASEKKSTFCLPT